MQSNKAITVIYLCSLKGNHFTEAVLHLTKPNSILLLLPLMISQAPVHIKKYEWLFQTKL